MHVICNKYCWKNKKGILFLNNKANPEHNQVFGIEVELPIAQYCTTNKVVEMVNNIFDIIVEQNKKSL